MLEAGLIVVCMNFDPKYHKMKHSTNFLAYIIVSLITLRTLLDTQCQYAEVINYGFLFCDLLFILKSAIFSPWEFII